MLLLLVLSRRTPPSLLRPLVYCCSTVDGIPRARGVQEVGITVKYGIEVISTLSSLGKLVCMVAEYSYLCA
jgi:hypothetical protein